MTVQKRFQQFILSQMEDDSKKSQEALAKKINVDQSTISRWLDETKPSIPGIEQLAKLAEGTNTDLETIVGYLYPELRNKAKPSPDARLVSSKFDRLPDFVQKTILFVAGISPDDFGVSGDEINQEAKTR